MYEDKNTNIQNNKKDSLKLFIEQKLKRKERTIPNNLTSVYSNLFNNLGFNVKESQVAQSKIRKVAYFVNV